MLMVMQMTFIINYLVLTGSVTCISIFDVQIFCPTIRMYFASIDSKMAVKCGISRLESVFIDDVSHYLNDRNVGEAVV